MPKVIQKFTCLSKVSSSSNRDYLYRSEGGGQRDEWSFKLYRQHSLSSINKLGLVGWFDAAGPAEEKDMNTFYYVRRISLFY